MATWRHNPKDIKSQSGDSNNNQFFSNEAVGNLSNGLIREGIQNNLDELKDESKPVRVRIFLSGEKYALPPKQFTPYLKDLEPHLRAENNGIMASDLPDFDKPIPFLVFEDFNTKGLEGDPFEYSYDDTRDKTKPHNFFFFWRTYGTSGKLGGKMGSWGVGKSVFTASSSINCYLAITIRDSDKKAYLIGQSVLKTHNLKDKPMVCGYEPYGCFANFDETGFSLPEGSDEEIEKVAHLFKLSRKVENQAGIRGENTGLSIIVPYPKGDITINNLLYSTIQQFFYPIILGKLEVEFVEEDEIFVLKRDNIKDELDKIDFEKIPGADEETKENLANQFKFTEWAIGLDSSKFNNLQFEKVDRAFEWRRDELFKGIEINKMRQDFDYGLPLAFKIPIKFQPEGKPAEFRYFTAFIQRDQKLLEPENYFIRDYLNIIGVKSLRKKGVRGMVIISDKDLVTFFGQAEGPAHTGWHKNNFRTKYEGAEECISFVQRSLEKLYSYLLMPSEGLDKNLLQDFFYIPDLETESPKGEGGNDGKKKSQKGSKPPEPKPKPYIISKIEGGFRISSNPTVPFKDEQLTVRVAYDRFDGNPFKRYSEFDFELRRLQVLPRLIRNLKIDRNSLVFEPEENEFELKVTGFDTKRDLIVDVRS